MDWHASIAKTEARSRSPATTLPMKMVPSIFTSTIAGQHITHWPSNEMDFHQKHSEEKMDEQQTKRGICTPGGEEGLEQLLPCSRHSLRLFIFTSWAFCLKIFVARLGGTEPGRENWKYYFSFA